MQRLCTIGYQGASAEAFIQALLDAQVSTLVDVRAVAWSRRPEFCRRALQQRLAESAIGYRHEPALGAPKALRDQARAGHRQSFEAGYAAHLGAQGPVLDQLAAALRGTAALMCMEREPSDCHRRLVADALAQRTGLAVEHLFAEGRRDAASAAQGRLPLE